MTKFTKAHGVTGVLCQDEHDEIYLRLINGKAEATWCHFVENDDGTCGFMQLSVDRCKELTNSFATFHGRPGTPPTFE